MTTPRLLSVLPTFLVPDVQRAAEGLRDRFAMNLCFVVGEPDCGFSIVDWAAGQGFHLASRDGALARPNGGDARDAYVRWGVGKEVDVLHAELLRRGAEILEPPGDRPWEMRELVARTPDGFVLCFGADQTGEWPSGHVTTSPEFLVQDPAASARHYHEVLGFRGDYGLWGEPPAYAIVARDGALVHLLRAGPGATLRSNRVVDDMWDACIECTGVDALHEELVRRGADVVRGPETQEHAMRDMLVADLDGHLLCFAEDVGGE